jgi:hypothetical protein
LLSAVFFVDPALGNLRGGSKRSMKKTTYSITWVITSKVGNTVNMREIRNAQNTLAKR